MTALTTHEPLIALVANTLTSPNSRTAYTQALRGFFRFCSTGALAFDRRTVMAYRSSLIDAGKRSSTVNVALSAIRKLANEAAESGYLDPATATAIENVPGVSKKGVRMGRWLDLAELKRLLALPGTQTLIGRRDRVLLGLMAIAGLRQAEAAGLEFLQVQIRDGRMLLVDLVGKGGRLRTVPVHRKLAGMIRNWLEMSGLTEGKLLRKMTNGKIGDGLTPEAIRFVVDRYSERLGVEFSCHDLRRSFAMACRKANAPIDQIQVTLGHSSVATTEIYLNTALDLDHAACDFIDF